MKINRKKLLLTQLFARLGEGLIGIFFPFFLLKTFDFTIPQVFAWGALFYGFNFLFAQTVFPFLRARITGNKVLAVGLFLTAIFYGLLAMPLPQHWFVIVLLTALYALGLILFWVEFNTQSFLANKSASRGTFFAHFQSIMIGVNIITPLVTGALLQYNLSQYSLLVAVLFFLLATFVGASIRFENNAFSYSWKSLWQTKKELWTNRSLRYGLGAYGVGAAFFYLAWGFFFHSVTENFAAMGMVLSVSAVFEVLSAQLLPKYLSKISLQSVFVVRMIDILIRSLLVFFAPLWFVALVVVVSGVLGPIFFVPFITRVHEHAEMVENKYKFFIFFELITHASRTIMSVLLFVATYFFELSTVYVIGILLAAIATIGYRKM